MPIIILELMHVTKNIGQVCDKSGRLTICKQMWASPRFDYSMSAPKQIQVSIKSADVAVDLVLTCTSTGGPISALHSPGNIKSTPSQRWVSQFVGWCGADLHMLRAAHNHPFPHKPKSALSQPVLGIDLGLTCTCWRWRITTHFLINPSQHQVSAESASLGIDLGWLAHVGCGA